MMPRIIIRIENLCILITAGFFLYSLLSMPEYSSTNIFQSRWYLVILTWLSFDLSALGYLLNKKIGAILYNLVHNYIWMFLLLTAGLFWENLNLTTLGLILATHISVDRFLGFGLKYPTDFKHTHIQKL